MNQVLVGRHGEIRPDFSESTAFPADAISTRIPRTPGDDSIWGPGINHRSFGIRPSCIFAIRWQLQP